MPFSHWFCSHGPDFICSTVGGFIDASSPGNMAPQPSHQTSIQSQQALLGHGDEPESRTGLGLEKRINDEEVLRNHTSKDPISSYCSVVKSPIYYVLSSFR